ncbi:MULTISPECIES: hypothetical protein [unclassified Moorena]|uniref:hypothetical protein n=1 Tax=unclassified Moorena TaxID=2683338 RepID=UPI0013FF4EB5|nr:MULTISPECIES: hypothetical protein [unclassified Moorena]NEO16975.1 hypothetical protein [Moorena sp. SIO3E8]NEQ03575.1 hypothetical protein [Moorena sp. SIO3F7]
MINSQTSSAPLVPVLGIFAFAKRFQRNIAYQLSAISYQLSVISYQLSVYALRARYLSRYWPTADC